MRWRGLLAWLALACTGAVVLAACTDRPLQPLDLQVPGDAEAGKVAIQRHGCAACHDIPGIPGAQGVVGPPLANMGERRTIAGRLPNTPENMARWVENPQDVDPGNLMPDVGVSPEEAINISAYLYTLR
jgi:cytochrome c